MAAEGAATEGGTHQNAPAVAAEQETTGNHADGNTSLEDDLAEQRRLAGQYDPVVEGDFIGPKRTTARICEEYAEADSVYKAKTQNLATDAPFYRPIKGDGSCGFRALWFSYFEMLARMKVVTKIYEEKSRILKMNDMLVRSGTPEFIWDDWVETTIGLFESLAAAVIEGDPIQFLERQFNEEETAFPLVSHFRMLTACYMTEHQDAYAAFTPDGSTIEQWCDLHVRPTKSEMEELSLKAAYDMLLDEAGFSLEVAYLDRSIGTQVNKHKYYPSGSAAKSVEEVSSPEGTSSGYPTISLLYRPGHYDILYPRSSDVPNEKKTMILFVDGSIPAVDQHLVAGPPFLTWVSQSLYQKPGFFADHMANLPEQRQAFECLAPRLRASAPTPLDPGSESSFSDHSELATETQLPTNVENTGASTNESHAHDIDSDGQSNADEGVDV